MPNYAIKDVQLTDTLTIQVGTEITLASLHDPKLTRAVITAAYTQDVVYVYGYVGHRKETGYFIELDYGSFAEVRRVNADGSIHGLKLNG